MNFITKWFSCCRPIHTEVAPPLSEPTPTEARKIISISEFSQLHLHRDNERDLDENKVTWLQELSAVPTTEHARIAAWLLKNPNNRHILQEAQNAGWLPLTLYLNDSKTKKIELTYYQTLLLVSDCLVIKDLLQTFGAISFTDIDEAQLREFISILENNEPPETPDDSFLKLVGSLDSASIKAHYDLLIETKFNQCLSIDSMKKVLKDYQSLWHQLPKETIANILQTKFRLCEKEEDFTFLLNVCQEWFLKFDVTPEPNAITSLFPEIVLPTQIQPEWYIHLKDYQGTLSFGKCDYLSENLALLSDFRSSTGLEIFAHHFVQLDPELLPPNLLSIKIIDTYKDYEFDKGGLLTQIRTLKHYEETKCSFLTSIADLQLFCANNQNLESLSLARPLTDEMIDIIITLPNLKSIKATYFIHDYFLSETSLEKLSTLTLQSLDINVKNASDLEKIANISSLTCLSLNVINQPNNPDYISQMDLNKLGKLTNLIELNIHGDLRGMNLAFLKQLESLKTLVVTAKNYSTSDLHFIGESNIENLTIYLDTGKSEMIPLPKNIKNLTIEDYNQGVIDLTDLLHTQIQSLSISGDKLTNKSADIIKQLDSLQSLSIYNCRKITTHFIDEIAGHLPKLKSLNIDNTRIDEEAFRLLKRLPNLQSLTLEGMLLQEPEAIDLLEITSLCLMTYGLQVKRDDPPLKIITQLKDKNVKQVGGRFYF